MKNLQFIWVGNIAVDSGCLSVADPSYWTDERLGFKQIEAQIDSDSEPPYELGDLENVGASMALVFPTTQGDGIYDVYTVWRKDEMVGFFTSFITDDYFEDENEQA